MRTKKRRGKCVLRGDGRRRDLYDLQYIRMTCGGLGKGGITWEKKKQHEWIPVLCYRILSHTSKKKRSLKHSDIREKSIGQKSSMYLHFLPSCAILMKTLRIRCANASEMVYWNVRLPGKIEWDRNITRIQNFRMKFSDYGVVGREKRTFFLSCYI